MDISTLQRDIEQASRRYARVHGIERSDDWLMLKLHEEVGELTQAHLALSGRARERGRSAAELTQDLHREIADVLGQVLLIAERFDVDLEREVVRKWLRPTASDDQPAIL